MNLNIINLAIYSFNKLDEITNFRNISKIIKIKIINLGF